MNSLPRALSGKIPSCHEEDSQPKLRLGKAGDLRNSHVIKIK